MCIATSLLSFCPGLSQEANQAAAISQDEILQENRIIPVQVDDKSIIESLNRKSPMVQLPYLNAYKDFKVEEFSIYGSRKNPFPEIKTYKIYDPSDASLTGRVTSGPIGLNIIYLKNGRMIRVYRPDLNETRKRTYVQEVGINTSDLPHAACTQHPGFKLGSHSGPGTSHLPSGNSATVKRNGSVKRIYRAAVMCTGEYYNANGGGSTNIRNLMIANLNDISAIFEKDLAVEMVMAQGAPRLQQDVNNDPFDPSFGGRTQQAQNAIEAAFPISRYDVGHVFHNHSSGDGWDTGGVAGLGVVCNDSRKASGWSGSFNNTTNSWIQLAAHEFGHMYDATHTFNGSGDSNCTPNISTTTAYEIGSGTTIMSYNGLCDSDQNIPAGGVSDNYFHINSLDRMVTYMENFGRCNESEWIEDNNNEPIANANPCGASFIIPRSTPFMLKGEGSDIDGDIMTYCWEQYDEDGAGTPAIGLIGTAAGSNTVCPLFRSFPPSSDPARYFPNLSDLSNNSVSDFEVLSRRQRAIKFRFTVRDNNPEGGAIDWEEIQVNVRNTGPLQVLTPVGGEIVQAGSVIEVTWDTNPFNNEDLCEKAIIRLSTDGGLSFPLVIADDIDYDAGQAMVNIPASFANTDKARLMLACDDYECFSFFDITNSNFTIESNCFAPSNLLCDTEEEEFDFGDQSLDLGLQAIQGTSFNSLLGPIGTGLPSMSPAVNNASGTCTRINTVNNPYHITRFSVTAPGTYVFNINNNLNDIVTAYTLFDADGFDPDDACSSFIESNASFINTSYQYMTSFSAELEPCKEYILASQVTNSSTMNLALSNISGPGQLIKAEDITDFDLTFLAVERNTEVVVQQSADADFRTLPIGEYYIVSAYYKSGGITPPVNVDPSTWIGLSIDDLLGGIDCFRTSLNQKLITVNQSCFVFDIELGAQTACDPATNTYEQALEFAIDMGPGTGTVEINGQSFDLDGDMLSITLTNLLANGKPVDLEFKFSDDIGCDDTFKEVFTAPANCCPIDVNLGGDRDLCEGESITLDAGSESTNYIWFKDGEILAETGQFLEVSEEGQYLVQVTHTSGCTNEDEAFISFEALPEITFDREEILTCEGDLEVLNAFLSISDGEISWTKDGEELPNTGSSLEIRESGTYELTVVTEKGCSSSRSINADFGDSPEVNLGPDILTCDGAITTLSAGNEGIEFEWRRNAFPIAGTESTIDINNFGVYSVIATNANGCIGVDTISVDYEPLPEFDFGRDVTRCFGNFYTIEAEESVFEIQWYLNGEAIPGANEITYTAMETGVYLGQIFVNDQCIEEDSIEVNYLDVPNVDLPELISACPGDVIDITIDDLNAVYMWSSESSGILPETSNILSVTESDIYYVEARSTTTFCIVRDTVEVSFTNIPQLELGPDQTVCDGDELIIGSPTNGFIVEWYLDGELIAGEEDENLLVEAEGKYLMRIGSGGACVSEDSINVSFFAKPQLELGDDIFTCPGEIITLDGGDPSNQFTWRQDGGLLPESSNILQVQESGDYSVEVRNVADCVSRDTVRIVFTELPELSLGQDRNQCEGDIITLNANSEGFAVMWYVDGELNLEVSGEQFEVTQSGQYVARVDAGADCSISDTINIEFLPYPVVELGNDITACPGETILLEVADNNYNFIWFESGNTTGDISNSIEVNASGSYSVEVSNAANCITRDTVDIEYIDLPVLNLGIDLEACEGESLLLGDVSNGFTVEWYQDNNLINGESDETLEVNSSGSYTMRVVANDNCSVSDTVDVQFFSNPNVELGEDRSACPGDLIELDAGLDGENYVWIASSQGALAEDSNLLRVDQTDTYKVTVTNEANCTTVDSVTISFVELPEIDLGSDVNDACEGDDFVLLVDAAGFMVEWQFEGETIPGETDEMLGIAESGTYSVIVSAGDDCSVSDDIDIIFNTAPQIAALGDAVACSGDQVTLTAGPDGIYRYIWSDDSMVLQDSDSGSLTVTTTGNYTVEAIDANNCSSTSSAQIEFIDAPNVELQPSLSFCEGSSETIVATSNVNSVEWYLDGNVIQGETALELEVNTGGEYVAVVGPGTQCEDRDTLNVELIPAPGITTSSVEEICEDQFPYVLEISTELNNSIQWFSDGMPLAGETGNDLQLSSSGDYSVVVTSPESCVSELQFNISSVPLSVNSISSVPELCEGEIHTLSAMSDGQNFEWYMDGVIISGQNDLNLAVTESGTYRFVSYNSLGCPTESEVVVNFNALPDAELGPAELANCSGASVELMVSAQQGLTYEWSLNGMILSNETSNSITAQQEGTYSLVVSNSAGCSSSDEVELMFFDNPSLQLDTEASFCSGESVTLNIDTDADLIVWQFGGQVIAQNTSQIDVTQAGTYAISVESPEGCIVESEIIVNENSSPDISIDNIELCPGESQEISVQAGFADYIWTGIMASGPDALVNYQSVQSQTSISASLEVIDNNNCSATDDFTITFNPELNAKVLSDRINICSGESAQLQVSGGLYYEWIDPNNSLSNTMVSNPQANPNQSTNYTVNITDDCPNNFASFDVEVIVNASPVVDAGPDTCAVANADLRLTASGALNYSWNNRDLIIGSSTSASIIVNLELDTTFTVTGTDENGCTDTDSVRVCVIEDPLEILTAVTLITPNGDASNDALVFRGLEAFPENKLTIFNRWGNVIFQKTGYQNDAILWDGTRDGEPLPADTYYYILEFSDFKIKKSITLLRD